MKTLATYLTLILSLILLSCNKEGENELENIEIEEAESTINTLGFTPVTEKTFDSLKIKPGSDYDYYEVRINFLFDTTIYKTLFSGGINPEPSIKLSNRKGIDCRVSDIAMFINILIYRDSEPKFLSTYDDCMEFLGPIDCPEDALFVAYLNGYYFEYKDWLFGIKEENNNFQIVACKPISMCAPMQLNKFLLEIDSSGNIKILNQEIIFKDYQRCS